MKLARLNEIEKLLGGWMEGCKSFFKDCSKQSKIVYKLKNNFLTNIEPCYIWPFCLFVVLVKCLSETKIHINQNNWTLNENAA